MIFSQDGGITGFATGVFQGMAGMATKPMVGCLDAVTHTGEAMREMAGGLAHGDASLSTRRSRFPQPFGPDGRMMPRTAETACGALLLAQFPLLKVCLWTDMHLRVCRYFEVSFMCGYVHSIFAFLCVLVYFPYSCDVWDIIWQRCSVGHSYHVPSLSRSFPSKTNCSALARP